MKTFLKKSRPVFLVLMVSILGGPNFVFAQISEGGGITIENPLKYNNFTDLLQGIINFLLTIAIPILVIMIIWAAFMLLTAGGNEQQVEKGRKALLWSVIGFAIITVGWGMVYIIKDILGCGGSGCS